MALNHTAEFIMIFNYLSNLRLIYFYSQIDIKLNIIGFGLIEQVPTVYCRISKVLVITVGGHQSLSDIFFIFRNFFLFEDDFIGAVSSVELEYSVLF